MTTAKFPETDTGVKKSALILLSVPPVTIAIVGVIVLIAVVGLLLLSTS